MVRFYHYLTLLTWTLSIIVDNILMLNCLVISRLIMSEGLKKSSPNVTTFFAKFQSQFDSLYLSLSELSILSVFLCFSCLFATSYGE